MSTQPEDGRSEETTRAPLTETEQETSRGPARTAEDAITDAEFKRLKELNPDDFE